MARHRREARRTGFSSERWLGWTDAKEGPVTATIVVCVGLLLGVGLVASQLVRLKEWLGKAPPAQPSDQADDGSD